MIFSAAVVQGIIFTETDASIEASFYLLDKDLLKDTILITEYPVLTALARNRDPSAELLNKFNSYLASKDASFPYLKKLYLVFSALIKTYCASENCQSNLVFINIDLVFLNLLTLLTCLLSHIQDDWTSIFAKNLGSNCLDSSNKELVDYSLKAIGNIGYLKNAKVLEQCAATKENSLETRNSAIQAFRRFSCEQIENNDGNYNLLQDVNEDAEIRINAFLTLVQCINSQKFKSFATDKLTDFLLKETDVQVINIYN